ncbi:MAG: four-carbon acid sugar kinase family protein [Verrucomicrobiota bacterium]|nr:four-carbon acid sugar kinase family protein [Verrucomicrobiota bacterium]
MNAPASPRLKLAYYGDDFTGSTDVLEVLSLAGVPTVLFLEPPTAALLAEFPAIQAVGVAGISRSLPTAQMAAELLPQFHALQALGAELVHYKICSTFDSSPETGSLGRAIELGREVFGEVMVPLVVGAPRLKRYVVFGQLFATVGSVTHRLDRHPTMSRHPVTPMRESDLLRHLAQQTALTSSLMDVLLLDGDRDALATRVEELLASASSILLFDTLTAQHLETIGAILWEKRAHPWRFLVGSSGIEYALAAHWKASGMLPVTVPANGAGAVDPLLVMSGSASPVTAQQIEYALAKGWHGLRLSALALLQPATAAVELDRVLDEALPLLAACKNVVIYLTLGPDDTALSVATAQARTLGLEGVGILLAQAQGRLLRELLTRSGLRRACVAGGDTSGWVARELGIYALEFITAIAPGAPLCRARSHTATFDGLEISLKGGQCGAPNYFECIRRGEAF